ncbi:MAG: transcriptional regulator, GntR family [Microvirga sp.]|nr:transcriptional regulator, GntR family [Microvirga sp.]
MPAGARLETENQFADRFGVNRHTVRKALAVLAERGLVRSTQGRGTFVEDKPLHYPISSKTRFSEALSRAGRDASGDLIESGEILADAVVAGMLGVETGSPVLQLVTLHRADGVPISLARTHMPLPRFEKFDRSYMRARSMTRAYARHGVDDYTRLSTKITARIAGVQEASLLELAPGRVVLVIDSVNVDAQSQPIQATQSLFAADRVEIIINA